MTAYSDQAYEKTAAAPAPRRRLNYDPSRPLDEDAFAEARRHSTRVRRLKIILPALAIAAIGIFWGAMRFVPSDLAAIARGAGIDVTADSVVMNRPHISGFEGTRRAYEVQAETAVQSLSDPKVVTFNKIAATIGLDGAGTASLDATVGTFDGNHNTLVLRDGVSITTDIGYSAGVKDAQLDLGKGSMVSGSPIVIKIGPGTIRANAVNVTDRGKHVTFSNGVSVTYLPAGDLYTAPSGK